MEPDALIERTAAALRARGDRMTPARRTVVAILADAPDGLTAEQILERVERVESGVHRATIYRTLDALGEIGVVTGVHFENGATAYRLAGEAKQSLYAKCRVCGTVVDLPGDSLNRLRDAVRDSIGFVLEPTRVALSGLCVRCAAKEL